MSRHLVIMAAGTGGHIMPGLAVAREMQGRGWTVSWLGTTQGMENRLVPPSGIPMDLIDFAGVRGKGLRHTLVGSLQLLRAFGRCWRILRRRAADVVLGMGGYVCFPGGVMAYCLRKPLMLVNADAALLMSNRALLPMAARIGFGFDGQAAHRTPRALLTGNPVRAEISAIAPPTTRYAARSGPLRVLVVGGSLGAQVLNDTVPRALAMLTPQERPQVVHQTGLAHLDAVRHTYTQLGVSADARPFIDDMATQLADCDLILCRSGAITVSEICAAGVASLLVPLVLSTTSHQRDNALYMQHQDAALHLPQTEFTPEALAARLRTLTRPALQAMAERARALALPHATQRVADELERLGGTRPTRETAR